MRAIHFVLLGCRLPVLAGSGFEPMPIPDPSGLKPGPALISGKTGEFTILGPKR
jgi:hypothetical protein